MHLVIDCQHLCVTLIRVVRADFINGALGDYLVSAADKLRVADLITAGRLGVCHRAAGACARLAVIAVPLIDVAQTRNTNHVFVHFGGLSRFNSSVGLGQEQTKFRRACWKRI